MIHGLLLELPSWRRQEILGTEGGRSSAFEDFCNPQLMETRYVWTPAFRLGYSLSWSVALTPVQAVLPVRLMCKAGF